MNQNGFESDEEEAWCLEQYRLEQENLQAQEDYYQQLLNELQNIAATLGIEHCISYLESLKERDIT